MSIDHTGYVTVTGKPNVGKSSLINKLLNDKVSITSHKPHTTRNKIEALYCDDNSTILFMDTPGYHKSNNKLDVFLNSEVKSSYKRADLALMLIDLTRDLNEEDEMVISSLKSFNIERVILVLTKFDVSSERVVELYKQKVSALINYSDCIAISAKNDTNIIELVELIKKYLPSGEPVQKNPDNDRLMIAETIREQIIKNMKQEVPYATNVVVESQDYDKQKNMFNISAVIVVEKESQKPIIIGKGGTMIKKIGTNARVELLKVFDTKINLKLFVKVHND
jgi:GTP-binding protein Era